ncbi:hydrogen gas-evolving membrane-bound hydrogenase subunit E [Orrella sp. JC864]|uniref:hydrogen gas-evolving membrane-bound hydrogenase subunit E n=1 Tax=Orrella sp. JC864 TaxID=3120298 RepID=UPI003008CBD5
MTLIPLIVAAFAASPIVFLLSRAASPAWAALLPAGLFCGFALQAGTVLHAGAVLDTASWIPALGITMAFRLDALSLVFALLITGIGTFIFLYASAYLSRDWTTPRFFTTLTLFMAAMLGAVLADDLVSLIVFWELTSLTSFMLIGYDPSSAQSRRSAQQGLLITVGGGLALLTGVILLGSALGTYRITEILAAPSAELFAQPLGTAIVLLIALGAFSKSAQAPLHAWLPNAMVAPTPVSAYLHSATMVKLGVYLLARMNPALSESPLWTPLLVTVGLATMFVGTVLAARQTDLKRLLAYSTVVSLGTLVVLVGTSLEIGAIAMATFLLVHALYKASLFMVAGIIDHEVGTRDASTLGRLARHMPKTAVVACLAALSMAGIPPLLGFLGKELVYEAGLTAELPWLAMGVTLLANACMVTIGALISLRCFFGKDDTALKAAGAAPHDPPLAMWIGPMILAALGLGLGLVPGALQALVAEVAAAVHGQPVDVSLSLWHGLTPMLALSGVTLLLGVAGYLGWQRLREGVGRLSFIDRWGTDALYDKALDGVLRGATWQTRMIQTGSLRHYMAMSIGIVSVAVLGWLLARGGLSISLSGPDRLGMELVLPLLLIIASLAVLRARSFVQGIIAAGMVGFGLAVVFLFGGAPDLAFTQFSVEALAIVIFLALIGHMPFRAADPRTSSQHWRDAGVAAAFGLMITVVLASVVSLPFDPALSDYFRMASYPEAHGRNLVNVIIVDFRAIDTLGEIAVLGLAALAAVAVFFGAEKREELPGSQARAGQGSKP